MSGGGGGPIIIKPMLDSGRCTAAEYKVLSDVLARQKEDGRFHKKDIESVLKIAREFFNRP